jgi:polysaccharide export outer membrane protein
MINRLLALFFLLTLITSCGYRPNIMMKADKDYPYSTKKDTVLDYEYRIQPNDYIDFRLYTNDGFKLVDLTTLNENINVNTQRLTIEYLVEHDGNVKLPLLGRVNLQNMTIKEAQHFLEKEYAKYYIEPFVLAKVINRRVVVFSGNGGSGNVITLANNNTTLLEGLALAGGIGDDGKAKKIKLIRGNPKNPEIYLIDLSTIEGMKQADFILQANDVIYVEPRKSLAREFTSDFAPLISLISSTITLFIVLDRL